MKASNSDQENRKKKVKVIMDSNALFVPLQFNIDVLSDLEILLKKRFEMILLSPVKRELEILAAEGGLKIHRMAVFALKFAEKCRYVAVNSKAKSVDDVILEVASRWNTPVFTNDSQLRKRLRDISVPVIYVRQKSRLEIEGMTQSYV